MTIVRSAQLAVALLLIVVAACERAPESGGSATTQSATDRLKEAAKNLKDEAKETARAVKDEAKEVGRQVAQAASEVKEQAKESAAAMKEEVKAAWASTRDDALAFSATALDKTRETIAALREKAAKANEAARPVIDKAISELESQAKTIGEKYEQLKATAPEHWQKASEEFAPALEKLRAAADTAAKQFQVTPAAPAGSSKIAGTLGIRERIALPDGTGISVKLLDVSDSEKPVTIAEHSFKSAGQPPYAFELPYDAAKIRPDGSYSLEATISALEKMIFRGTHELTTLSSGPPAKIEMTLKRAGGE